MTKLEIVLLICMTVMAGFQALSLLLDNNLRGLARKRMDLLSQRDESVSRFAMEQSRLSLEFQKGLIDILGIKKTDEPTAEPTPQPEEA